MGGPGAYNTSCTVSSKEAPTQLSKESFEEALEALLQAQRLFKLEVDERWRQLEAATSPLLWQMKSLRQEALAAGAHLTPGLQAKGRPQEAPAPECELAVNHEKLRANNDSKMGDRQPADPKGDRKESDGSVVHDQIEVAIRSEEFQSQVHPDKAAQGMQRPSLHQFMMSAKFDMLVGLVIFANMIVIMIKIEYEGRMYRPESGMSPLPWVDTIFEIIEHVFTTLFLVELVLHLVTKGMQYLRNLSNLVDTAIVIGSCLDSWLLPMFTDDSSASGSVSVLRVFRLLRLMKVLRVVRIMKTFAPLRVLVQAVLSSIGSLVWSMTLLFVLEIIGAILLAQSLQATINDDSLSLETRNKLWLSFGTMMRAWLSLFEITMAPGGFIQFRYLYDDLPGIFTALVVIYVCFVTFAVTRVITALFLKATLSESDKETRQDECRQRERRMERSDHLCDNLAKAEGEVTEEGQAMAEEARIDMAGLDSIMKEDWLKDWVQDAGLSKKDTERLFKALDLGDGTVCLKDFLDSINQICSQSNMREVLLYLLINMNILLYMKDQKVAASRKENGFLST